jgi:peroxiredoxin
VKTEYDALMAAEPENPVYPMALAIGTSVVVPQRITRSRYEKVAVLAPAWNWTHYAKAQLLAEKDPNAAAAELTVAIGTDPTMVEAYNKLISIQEKSLNELDEAIATAEKLSTQSEYHAIGMYALWRLRFARSNGSPEAKAKLKAELDNVLATSKDTELLTNARSAYKNILKDDDGVKKAEARLKKVDPDWFAGRDTELVMTPSNISGVRRADPVAGRQTELRSASASLDDDQKTPAERMAIQEELLTQKPDPSVRRFIYEALFKIAETSADTKAILKYSQALIEIDPTDIAVYSRTAIALADQDMNLDQAARYANLAYQTTDEFHPIQCPRNTDPDYFNDSVPEQRQRAIYKRQRALALEAEGLVLCKTGKCREAEPMLRGAVELGRSERNLLHLSEALRNLGRIEDADKVAVEAGNEYAESLKRKFTNDVAPDFQLETPDGRKVKLSDYKGKVVLLNFWATWCAPCAQEMPRLIDLYDKYRDRGVEVLAISTDEKNDRAKVGPYIKNRKLNFTVLYDEGMGKAFNVDGLPTSVVIDKQGIIRYRVGGFYDKGELRAAETVLTELLK